LFSLAAEYKLKVLYHATFHDLFSQERDNPEFEQLLLKMKVVTPEGESELTEDQWEAASKLTTIGETCVLQSRS
jgi:mRNA (guanine-N7-)-methyltransferase